MAVLKVRKGWKKSLYLTRTPEGEIMGRTHSTNAEKKPAQESGNNSHSRDSQQVRSPTKQVTFNQQTL